MPFYLASGGGQKGSQEVPRTDILQLSTSGFRVSDENEEGYGVEEKMKKTLIVMSPRGTLRGT